MLKNIFLAVIVYLLYIITEVSFTSFSFITPAMPITDSIEPFNVIGLLKKPDHVSLASVPGDQKKALLQYIRTRKLDQPTDNKGNPVSEYIDIINEQQFVIRENYLYPHAKAIAVFPSKAIKAEPIILPFCQLLKKIIADYPNQLSNIKGEQDNNYMIPHFYARYILKGAEKTVVSEMNEWICTYGYTYDKKQATDAFQVFKNALSQCGLIYEVQEDLFRADKIFYSVLLNENEKKGGKILIHLFLQPERPGMYWSIKDNEPEGKILKELMTYYVLQLSIQQVK